MKTNSYKLNPPTLINNDLKKLGLTWEELFNPQRAVYANRALNMSEIKLVGFDMDYTLAVYKKEPMEKLQYDLARKLLIDTFQYPLELEKTNFNSSLIIRGLVVDKQKGNILKIDNHSYVWRASHGRRVLSEKQIDFLYGKKRIKIGSKRYHSLDTFFSVPEACLFIDALETFYALEKNHSLPKEFFAPASQILNFEKIFCDIRYAMDQIHSDGSLKNVIMDSLETYIERNSKLIISLKKLRSDNKKLFLLTNSSSIYTDKVMTHILGQSLKKQDQWKNFFDIIIVDANKPNFFTHREPFKVSELKSNQCELDQQNEFTKGKFYHQGNIEEFHRRTNVRGREVLYIGDHIYGDILRSKKNSLWRTCLIIKDLRYEIKMIQKYAQKFKSILQIKNAQIHADKRLMRLRTLFLLLEQEESLQEEFSSKQDLNYFRQLRSEIKSSTKRLQDLNQNYNSSYRALEELFHERWGRLFNENEELSHFGAQVKQYACIYTDCINNFLHYGSNHVFLAQKSHMPHQNNLT